MRELAYICLFTVLGLSISASTPTGPGKNLENPYTESPVVSDTIPIQERYTDFVTGQSGNPFDLTDPPIIEQNVEYDAQSGLYIITEKIGNDYFRAPTYMTFSEYMEWKSKKEEEAYFKELAGISSKGKSSTGKIDPIAKIDVNKSLVDRLFGGTEVDIKPQGNIDMTFGYDYQKVDNPILPIRQQTQGGFDFDMDIQMNVVGNIGEKMDLNFDYNTQSTFDFENKLKLQYDSDQFSEDEIIKDISAGDVSLPLRSSLIQGSQNLFGFKTDLQFGRLTLSGLISQQRSERENIQIQGGSLLQDFEVGIDEYDENRHFFLSQYNRESFEPALKKLPLVNSLYRLKKIEVWITPKVNDNDEIRNVIALADLGELGRMTADNPNQWLPSRPPVKDITGQDTLPSNEVNSILATIQRNEDLRYANNVVNGLSSPPFNFQQPKDFRSYRARLLRNNEYSINDQLGYISLNVKLRPNEVLGVAYEYDYDGVTYKVGEFSNEVPRDSLRVLYLKMLKSSNQRVDLPEWDLMMKNVYPLGAFQVSKEDFRLDIFYRDLDNTQGRKRFLPEPGFEDKPLLRVFNLDKLNAQGDPQPDGFFDFVPGMTINTRNGSVMFPVLEPFGSSLENLLGSTTLADKYAFHSLYDSTITRAREQGRFNRFLIKGSYKASVSSEISLGAFNIPQGSVRVTAGGQVLQEGIDYEINYSIGRVTILNESFIQSGTPINISYENNNLFSFQKKNMIGLRADYMVSKHLNIGGTYLHLFERPFTQKVNVGDDPINNRIYGLDLNYSKEAPWLTKLVDKIPLINTKAPSKISLDAEMAALRPGHSRAINIGNDDAGTVYLDDFEGAASGFDMRTPQTNWVLASIPQNAVDINGLPMFPESELADDRRSGANRALTNWYAIDRAVNSNNNDDYVARINQREVFPNQSNQGNIFNFDARTFDITYYPDERGPYNFDTPTGTDFSAGLDGETGKLREPETRWGGIMRNFTNNDFEANNFEFIEFWMLNPFGDKSDNSPVTDDGVIYLHLGTVSEDILKDNRQFYENALPRPNETVPVDQTNYTRVPRIPPITNAFDNENRSTQDLGLDGMDNDMELVEFEDYLSLFDGMNVITTLRDDPANDDFVYFDDPDVNSLPTLDRYRKFNHPENNSPISADQVNNSNRVEAYTNRPDSEDLNLDKSFEESENYYQYAIPIRNNGMGEMEFNDFVTDTIQAGTSTGKRIWYRMKVPIDYQGRQTIGQINNLRNIQFIRMILKDFDERVTFRFAQFDLTRNSWRKYRASTLCFGDDPNNNLFDVDAVNIEENGKRTPFNYVLPNGITRENIPGQFSTFLQNEQSLSIRVCDLPDGCSKAIYKNVNQDMRLFERIKMFVHAEELNNIPLADSAASLILRLGDDFDNNYYEYEVPLYVSDLSIGDNPSDIVWRPENEIDFALQKLVEAKKERNNSGWSPIIPYEVVDTETSPNKFIRVRGNPNLGQVRTIMIGVKNPTSNPDNPMGDPICTEVWVNELRLSGLDERGGVAGLARLNMQLADFGNVAASVNYSSVGFGAIDQKLANRAQQEDFSYDVATTLELGNFFPKSLGIRLPMYAQISNATSTPRFDPNDQDIDLKERINGATDQAMKDSIKDATIEKTTIRSLNFTNVRKERTSKGTPMPWDISNFSATYAFTETDRRDPILRSDKSTRQTGSLDYNFSTRAKYIQPLKNLSKSKLLKPLTEFNFNPIPNSFTFSTSLNRVQGVRQYRFAPETEIWRDNRFTWDRTYGLQWDFSKSLRMNYNASNQSIVDEIGFDYEDLAPDEYVNPLNTSESISPSEFETRSKSFRQENLKKFGRPKNYSQNISVTYDVPLKHIPLLNFMTLKAQYKGSYNWAGAALNIDSLGNVISNSQNRQINADINLEKLYDKWAYLKKINNPKRKSNAKKTRGRDQKDDKAKEPIKVDAKAKDKKDKKKKDRQPSGIERALIRPLMAVRKVRFTYNEDFTTIVPGFKIRPRLFGLDENFAAPGAGFVFGLQPDQQWFDDIKTNKNDWISYSRFLNQEVYQTHSTKADAKVSIEPFKDFRIEVNGSYAKSDDNSRYFKNVDDNSTGFADGTNVDFREENFRRFGSYNITYMALNTLFKDGLENVEALFDLFESNRTIISRRLGVGDHTMDGRDYSEGFGRTQQDVLVPAFISAYSGKDINSFDQDWSIFKIFPRPNWTLTYNGLNKLPWFKDIFQNVSLTHGYKSRLQVNSFITDRDYNSNDIFKLNDITANYYTELEIPAIIINEEFSPLLGLSIKTKSDMTIDVNLRKSRGLTMSFTNNELREMRSSEYTVGFGYTLKNVYLGFLPGMQKRNKRKRVRTPRNSTTGTVGPGGNVNDGDGRDLEIKFDFSLRDDLTLNHLLDEDTRAIPTRGTKAIRISPSLDYEVSESLVLRLFFDYSKTTPYVSTSYPITNARGGLQVRILFN